MATDTKRSRWIRRDGRKSRRQRGYGAEHDARRRALAPFVAGGLATCARCGEIIEPGTAWDLGHDDLDRSRWTGPEHASCNRAAPNRLMVSREW